MSGQEAGSLTDRTLLHRAAAGDRGAFECIVERHQASVFRLARAVVSDAREAEDVLQQAFLAAWQSAGQFRGEASARTWLLTIARHAALRARARRAREPIEEVALDDLGVRAGWGGPDPEMLALAADARERLEAALARLTPAEREVLVLRELEGLSGAETATVLGVGQAAMKSRLHRARLALAAALRSEVRRATR